MPNTDDPSSPFLNVAPPHWAARGLAYLLIFLFTTALLFSVVLRVPEIVSSPFVLVPVHGTDPVRASRSGNVAEVRAAEGQSVLKGDPLFVIQSSPVGDRSAELHALKTQLTGTTESLTNAKREYESQRLADDEESQRLQKRLAYLPRAIDFKKEQLTLTKEVAARYHKLHERGFVSWEDYASRQLEVNKVAVEQAQFETELKETQTALDKLHHESVVRRVQYQELDRRLQEDREKAQFRISALQKELVHSESNELSVLAPCAGTLLRLRIKSPGAFVPEGEELCELACAGEQLQAELTVPQSGVGRLKLGQGVKLLYEAFPYQRYGVRYGTVRWVSPASVMVEDSAAFHAFVDIADEAVVVEGQPRPLKAGMRGAAQVVVGRMPLIAYAFEPLRQLRESVADAPVKEVTEKSKKEP